MTQLVNVGAAFAVVTLCCGMTACGSDQGATGGASVTSTTTTTTPISPRVQHAGAAKCQSLTPRQALARFTTLARRSNVSDAAAVRKGLLKQVKAMPKDAKTGPVAARMAAGLYAVTVEPARRPAAFQGCLAALTEERKR
ncbi:MAG: hypothetical protein ABW167_02335 [Baekduia sp.]